MSKRCIRCKDEIGALPSSDSHGDVYRNCFDSVASGRRVGLESHGLTEKDLDPKLNPKHNAGRHKYPMSPIPVPVLAEVGVAMLEGALKYGYYNFRSVDISTSTYYDAANRHIQAWWEGEEIDPDSGINHISKAIASLVVLRDSMMNDTIVDDRPPATPAGWKEGLNAIAARLHDKYDNDELNIIA